MRQQPMNFIMSITGELDLVFIENMAIKVKKDGILTSRKFLCFKDGKQGDDKRDHLTKESRAETRIGCKARMVISLD